MTEQIFLTLLKSNDYYSNSLHIMNKITTASQKEMF